MNKETLDRQRIKKEKLLLIAALCNEFPLNAFDRINLDSGYGRILKHRVINDGLMEMVSKDGLKGLVLTKKEKDRLIKANPKRYAMVSNQNTRGQSRRARSHLFARTYCSLLNADIEFLNDKKPYIYAREHNGDDTDLRYPLLRTKLLNTEPVFYDSKDIKYQLEEHTQQIRNSAMMGLILTRNDCWALYNLDSNRYPLGYATEMKASGYLSDGTFLDQGQGLDSKAIFLVSDFDAAADLILGNKAKDIKPSKVISCSPFTSIYIIPENHNGDVALRTLCHIELRDIVETVFHRNFGEPVEQFIMFNDAVCDDSPVCNATDLDIVKLLNFKRALLINDLTGLIACFDFQEEFLARIMKPAKVKFSRVYMEEYEEAIQNVSA